MKSTRSAPRLASICLRGAALALLLAAQSSATVPGPGTLFSSMFNGSGQDFALAVASDSAGNTYVAGLTYSPDFAVTAGAAQTKFGQTCDAWVAKIGPDGKRLWSTYLGGILDDWATGVAVDGAGNVWVTGYTRSPDFPLVKPIQSIYNNGATDDYDAFVAKFSPDGSTLLYSTFLGSDLDDGGNGIAIDGSGNVLVAITGMTTRFPGAGSLAPGQFGILITKLDTQGALLATYFHPGGSASGIALDASGAIYVSGSASPLNAPAPTKMFGATGNGYALVFKLSADGSRKTFETGLGGSANSSASGVAVNAAGEVFVAGTTTSADFPLVRPLQSSTGARPLWKSTDGGVTWTPIDNLPFAIPQVLAADPSNPQVVYASTGDLGVFKSVDAGAHWTRANNGIAESGVRSLTIDPSRPQTLYASTGSKVYKTTDGAANWSVIDAPSVVVGSIVVDPQNSSTVYELAGDLRRSTDGGATWTKLAFPGTVRFFAVDPHVSGLLYAFSNAVFCGFFCGNNQPGYFYRSVDAGATWIQSSTPPGLGPGFTVDASTNPATVYMGMGYRTTDGGVTWTALHTPFGIENLVVTVDAVGTVYVPVQQSGVYVSHDRGETWILTGNPTRPTTGPSYGIQALAALGASGTLLAEMNQIATAAFVSKLSADGATLEFSTYLRAHTSLQGFPLFAAEPPAMTGESWISGIALDPAGDIVLAGGVRGADFPTANAAQTSNGGHADAFVTKIAGDGSGILYSTYFGGTGDDGALAVAVDPQGNAIAAGQTWSGDFPLFAPPPQPTGLSEAFVVKLATGAPQIDSVVNGASFLPGIAAGAWVTIRGTNLSNHTRTWTSDDIVAGKLPTSLDGVSVTIGGRPAFIEYVSATQINVQAPTDSALPNSGVVVTNNGRVSRQAPGVLNEFAPAFFMDGGTTFVAASRLPDYALVADPSVIPGAVAAKPGDLLVLWGTGFGTTSPGTAAGIVVQAAPAAAVTPTLTIGSVSVPVISAVLTTGLAGVYQVTIQLPSNIPAGNLAVQASVGGAATQSGVSIFVTRP